MLYGHCCSASQATLSTVLHRLAAALYRATPHATSASLRAHAHPEFEHLDVRLLQRLQGHANLCKRHMPLLSVCLCSKMLMIANSVCCRAMQIATNATSCLCCR